MKKVKFPLEMTNGFMVRNIDELKENFDIKKIVGYFLEGKLQTWLEERYYDEEFEAISKLDESDSDLSNKLCSIFGVDNSEVCSIDTQVVKEEQEKKEKIKQIIDDEKILDEVSSVAFNQEDLQIIYLKKVNKIYLVDGVYNIDLNYEGVEYIGIQENAIVHIDSEKEVNFLSKGIKFKNVRFDEEYDKKLKSNISQKNRIIIDEKKLIYITTTGKLKCITLKKSMTCTENNIGHVNKKIKCPIVEIHRRLTGSIVMSRDETYAVLDAEGNIYYFNSKNNKVNRIMVDGVYRQICLTSGIYGAALWTINEKNEVIYFELEKYSGESECRGYCEKMELPPIMKITTDGTNEVLGLDMDGKVHIVNKINTSYKIPENLPRIKEFVLSDQLSYIDVDGNAGCVYDYSNGPEFFERKSKDNVSIVDIVAMPMRCAAVVYSDGTIDFVGENADAENMLTNFKMPLRWILGEIVDKIQHMYGMKSQFDGVAFGITTDGYLCTPEGICEIKDVDGIEHKIKLFD